MTVHVGCVACVHVIDIVVTDWGLFYWSIVIVLFVCVFFLVWLLILVFVVLVGVCLCRCVGVFGCFVLYFVAMVALVLCGRLRFLVSVLLLGGVVVGCGCWV